MKSTPQFPHWVLKFICTLLIFIPQIICADNRQTEVPVTAEALPIMPAILVEALRVAPTTGMTIIDKEIIENLPTRNGSINEIIGVVPGLQYGEYSLSSFTGGELTPPVISISGSRFYDNNYTLDGSSNNNPLDPVFDDINSPYKLPSHPQIHFLHPEVIEQITVYNSNIPAEFGGFTGGQIDVQLIDPDPELWGKIRYRTTSDQWTKFHIDQRDQEDFYNSNYSDMQPRFRKHDFGLTFNTPMGNDISLITSYQQLYSEIPLQHLGDISTQTRRQEVYLAKLSYDLSNTANLSLTALYTPTSSQYFAPDYKNSDYTIDTKNYSFVVQAENQLSNSQVELTLGYTGQKTVRNAHENRFAWSAETASIDWPNTRLGVEGGRGLLNTGQEQLGIKSAISFNSMHWGQTNHRLKFGGEATYSNQYYHRPKTNYHYYSPDAATLNTPIVCAQNDPACIDNEQYLLKRTKYLQADTDVEITDFAVFIQDSIIWKRLEIAPGVRISYDDFSGNLNIASRFAASLDVFGNQSTTLFAGKNRYYSGTLLTHALYKDIAVIRQAREDQNSDWEDIDNRPMTFRYANGEIKTPYSDELTLGLIQKVFGGKLKIQYIEKTNKDELARSKISDPERIEPDIYLFNNFGRSEHKSIQLSWQRSWQNHFLEINSTWQETTTSHDDYFETLDADDIAETIWYDGDELHYYEIPKTDFNRPIIANLVYICKLPYNVTFTNRTKFRGAYWKLKNTRAKQQSIVHPDQESYIFEKKKSHSSFLFDWRLSWKTPRFFKQNTTLSLDIYNVLNHKTNLDYQSGDYGYDYELGRQFWAGVEFKF